MPLTACCKIKTKKRICDRQEQLQPTRYGKEWTPPNAVYNACDLAVIIKAPVGKTHRLRAKHVKKAFEAHIPLLSMARSHSS